MSVNFDEAFKVVINKFDLLVYMNSHGPETLKGIVATAEDLIRAKSGLEPNLLLFSPTVGEWIRVLALYLREQGYTVIREPRLASDELIITHRCHDMAFLALNEDKTTYSLIMPNPAKYGVRIGDIYPEGTLDGK